MNIMNRSGRLRRRVAFSLAIIVSGCTEMVSLVEASPFATAIPAQKQSASNSNDRRATQKNQQSDDKDLTRPRRAEGQTEAAHYASADGPIVRVALMTDVSSVALSSSSDFIVRRAATGFDEGTRISGGSLRVEMRQHPEPVVPLRSSVATYRVSVGSSIESRGARKLLDELKKKFFEPVAMVFDEKQKEYCVLIGEFTNRSQAAQFLERLRKSGYESLRIVSEQKATDTLTPDSITDTNARAAKYESQPSRSAAAPSSVKPDRRPIRLIALAADKVAASSGDELVISPAEGPDSTNQNRPGAVSSVKDESSKHANHGDPSNREESQSEFASRVAAVRIGNRDYRGEIHVILNLRGRINVVNALPLEEYLRGVVPMELSPGSYPEIEALKAQAVAARSYALAHLGQHRDEGFDLVDDTRAQVYGGLSAERELTNRAIYETRGIAVVFPSEDGKLVPIEALYTANCGGRTENNDEVFGGKPVPYLRAVACAPDGQSVVGREIVSSRTREALIGIDGRSISREVALLSVLGFSVPRRVTSSYLSRSAEPDEVRNWIEQAAQLNQREKPSFTRGDGTHLADFARLINASVYGEGRATTLLAPADVDYLLGGLRVQQLPREARADVAMLLRDGILRLPADAALDGRAPVTRGQAIETLARAISVIHQPANLKTQISDSKSQISNLKSQAADSKSQISSLRFEILKSGIALSSENGHLIIAASGPTRDSSEREKGSRFTSVNASGPGRLARPQQEEPGKGKPSSVRTKEAMTAITATREDSRQNGQPGGLEISEAAWLFRTMGGESHQMDRLTIIGGERVAYHLNAKGQVDFLEASISDRSASSDRFSSVAQWQERVPIEEMQRRLARAHINVGRLEKIEPVTFSSSSRVTEVEVKGYESRVRLRRPQIRAVLGVKEYLFVVDRETDARGQVVAFVFTGRGWGHGVGMCQTGAYGLAREGYSYTAILQKYYTGVKLHKMYD
ncbi:MAG TPA: SpoIID/LytB domain-containing protein [Blastocatellia bacterium]|nr:SpoIID/LytB domain-containing protein [Blastocatellia bacterium]